MSLKSRAIIAAIRAANQLRAKKELKSLNPFNIKTTKDIKSTRKQKPKHPHGGAEQISQRGTHYGLRGKELAISLNKNLNILTEDTEEQDRLVKEQRTMD